MLVQRKKRSNIMLQRHGCVRKSWTGLKKILVFAQRSYRGGYMTSTRSRSIIQKYSGAKG